MKWRYSREVMERYFNDPEYRKSARKKKKRTTRNKRAFRFGIITALVVLLTGYVFYVISGLPSLEELENPKPELATRVLSADGQIIDQFFMKNRALADLKEVPHYVVQALISTEDKKFYSHWGLDPLRIMSAMAIDIIHMRAKEGASTITQQLARNLYLNQDVTLTRKIREAITAVQIERTYTKQEILAMYLNDVYFGRGSYGIESASQLYFDESSSDLTLPQAALLIGMLRSPGRYDPLDHPSRAMAVRNIVLKNLLDDEKISEATYKEARKAPLDIKYHGPSTGLAPHFVEMVRQELERKAEKYGFDIYRDGLTVYTTLDSRMQQYADQAVDQHIQEYQKMFDSRWNWKANQATLWSAVDKAIKDTPQYHDAANEAERKAIYKSLRSSPAFVDSVKKAEQTIQVGFVCIDPKTGYIKALVGASNYRQFRYGLNHVTQIERQPGSAFKPFVYTVAIDNGYAPSYKLLNQPVTVIMPDGTRWSPRNADGEFDGEVTLRNALKYSINVVAVRAIQEIAPINQVIEYAHRMGITTYIPPYASIAIGTASVVPIQLVSAYGVFANEGVLTKPISILRIEDKNGNVIEQNHMQATEVLSKQTAYLMTDMLRGVINGGTGSRIRNYFYLDAAGKTGTTQNFADAWFVGYTPQLVAGAWVGFDDDRVHFTDWDGQGGRAAAPIWGIFMKDVYDDKDIGLPISSFVQPDGVVTATICAQTGMLATEFCPQKITEIFNSKYLPPVCNVHTSPNQQAGSQPSGKIGY
ncbi:MAG: PBP1A family penicillin-binding protein [Bacteroidetes bacterium]|nr:PBP1A family penicillin-binding protein [Bacteroidota bacterium]MCL5739009.1 PBP1A family penicillin-binding protein [Bacteroidota bacterium]